MNKYAIFLVAALIILTILIVTSAIVPEEYLYLYEELWNE